MDPLTVIGACFGLCAAIAGATWALRTKLGDIELALREHVVEDKAIHDKVIKLEDAAKEKRRGRR